MSWKDNLPEDSPERDKIAKAEAAERAKSNKEVRKPEEDRQKEARHRKGK